MGTTNGIFLERNFNRGGMLNSLQQALNLLSQYGAKMYLSVGGPGELWETCIDNNCAANVGYQAGQVAAQYGLDGVELSVSLQGRGTIPSNYETQYAGLAKNLTINAKNGGGFSTTDMSISS